MIEEIIITSIALVVVGTIIFVLLTILALALKMIIKDLLE